MFKDVFTGEVVLQNLVHLCPDQRPLDGLTNCFQKLCIFWGPGFPAPVEAVSYCIFRFCFFLFLWKVDAGVIPNEVDDLFQDMQGEETSQGMVWVDFESCFIRRGIDGSFPL